MWPGASLEGQGGPVRGVGRGGLGPARNSQTPEGAPRVCDEGGEGGPVLRGRAARTQFLRWEEGNGPRPSLVPPAPPRGPGGHPSSHIPDLAGNPSLLPPPPPPPPPPCDCKRQQTLHGSFTPINQPDRQARMGPTGSGVSRTSLCLDPAPLSAAPRQPLHCAHPKIPRPSQAVLTPSPTCEWGN